MKRLQSDARNSTGPATSSGRAIRPSGVAAAIESRNDARVASLLRVGYTSPGATQFTRTPSGPSSAARLRLNPISADFADWFAKTKDDGFLLRFNFEEA